ncbi:MAG TPA: RimK family alpha-L-glutamate ligase [Gaiellaceae bacterium]|jgi:RimK family alpha-L-glutamate ligase|nr:RimK family alpha-L-glutamate ligase [Gaiellaceae bacterium]
MEGIWIAAGRANVTNESIIGALHEQGLRAGLVDPTALRDVVQDGDLVLARLDVRRSIDGIEDGVWALRRAERRGVRVLNRATTLIACHDKLETALALARAGIPHPPTVHVRYEATLPALTFPLVVKPRFGSWGRDVTLCTSPRQLKLRLRALRRHAWFRRSGALLQALVPPVGFDLRLVVAGGRVVGAIERVAAPGEWRTNIALGGARRPVDPPPAARELALAAAAAVGGDLVGVDLLPLANGGYVVIELNGAVDFTSDYSLAGKDVFDEVADVLGRTLAERPVAAAPVADGSRATLPV